MRVWENKTEGDGSVVRDRGSAWEGSRLFGMANMDGLSQPIFSQAGSQAWSLTQLFTPLTRLRRGCR
jgi:hypothetical protein